ncbi:MAG TPA: muconolactone Delta-isomerase family protein [Streptosporangiaceae bacterium]|jgi:muconolactone delta-isomerase
MDYLVTMTTHVPDGTPEQAVEDIKAREAAHTRDLAAQGHILRLWRPPLKPGEWRTLGLFAAAGQDQLGEVLASMPLHIWRTDEVTPLWPHPNDPVPARTSGGAPEFLISMTISVPEGTPESAVAQSKASEAERAHELADQGHLLRLWTPPAERGQWLTLGLWSAGSDAEMDAILESLPQYGWMTTQTTPLTPHPSDPAVSADQHG